MKSCNAEIVFQEVPGEISLAFSCTGCPVHCPDCHSKFLWDKELGEEFNEEYLMNWLGKYAPHVSCVLFYGGEWEEEWLIGMLKLVKGLGLKTALYTGLDDVSKEIKDNLDYLKTGPFVKDCGPLNKRTTNQRMWDLKKNEDITSRFWRS